MMTSLRDGTPACNQRAASNRSSALIAGCLGGTRLRVELIGRQFKMRPEPQEIETDPTGGPKNRSWHDTHVPALEHRTPRSNQAQEPSSLLACTRVWQQLAQ